MEEDEMEMDAEELQMWVRDQVEKAELTSPAVLQKYDELHRLLEARQNQTEQIMQLCQSLTAFENLAKELYSELGWEYEVLDSNEGHPPPSSVSSENRSSPSPGGQTTQLPKTQKSFEDQKVPFGLKEKPVVVLRRLSMSQLAKFKVQNPPVLQNGKGDWNDLRDPEVDSNDEEFQIPDYITQKKRKIHHKNQTLKERPAKRIRTEVVDKTGRDVQKIPPLRISLRTVAPSDATKDRGRQSEPAKTAAAARRSKPARPRSTPEKTRTPPASVEKKLKGGEENKGKQAANASNPAGNQTGNAAGATSAKSHTTVPAQTPPEELTPNTTVLARKTGLQWELGKIKKIVTKGDGGVKYKINFDQKGKRLVSGHHMAFKSVAKADQLDIGSRVVVQQGEKYLAGILGEVPSRKNRMRFLVFTDDGAAVYVGLPLLHVVCRPLEDPLDDIRDKNHRIFMKQYLQDWPFPPQSHYKVGEVMKAKHQGTQQDCEVLLIDSSLLKVIFQSDRHTEWIYRGSLRLDHMVKLRHWMVSKNQKKT